MLFFVAFPWIQFETKSTKIDNFSDLLILVAFLSFEFKQVYLNPQAAMFFFMMVLTFDAPPSFDFEAKFFKIDVFFIGFEARPSIQM